MSVSLCPLCKARNLEKTEEKKLLGLATTELLTCPNCGAAFASQAQGRYKLVEVHDKTPPVGRTYQGDSFSLDEWELLANGASVHWDAKAGRYVPYRPDEYTEYKRTPTFGGVPPPFDKDGGTVRGSGSESDDSGRLEVQPLNDETRPLQPLVTDTGLSKDKIASDYQLTDAGEFFLNMSVADMLQTYHMLKSFQGGAKLTADQLKRLEETGFIE